MYTLKSIDTNKIPKATKFLYIHIMCGACNYKCCNSPSFVVQCTPEEQERLGLPEEFPQQGRCPCLTDTGCIHGDGRPIYCKFFPLQISEKNGPSLVVMHWCILHCPTPNDYIFVKNEKDRYVYRVRENISKGKRKNTKPILVLDKPLEETYPNAINSCGYALDILYGAGTAQRIKEKLKKPEGFGFGGPRNEERDKTNTD